MKAEWEKKLYLFPSVCFNSDNLQQTSFAVILSSFSSSMPDATTTFLYRLFKNNFSVSIGRINTALMFIHSILY